MELRNFLLAFFVVLICLNILAWYVVFETNQANLIKVVFFDVGQGDSIFIETQAGHQIIIDGGPDKTILEKLSQEMPFYDKTIDLLILTHPEKDHMAGLIEVLKAYDIQYVLWTGVVRETSEYSGWIKALNEEQKEGVQIKIAQKNQKIIVPSHSFSAELEILHPFENLKGKEYKDSNNTSIVLRLSFGENSFLFTGDVYESVEKQLVIRENSHSNSFILASNVLKVAHHGSKTSTSKEFLEKVSPKIAVIQCGENNSYGHPHQQILEELNNHNVEILRTDEVGNIKILSDGTNYKIKNLTPEVF